jgi:predicted dehydrogenase
MKSSVTRRNFVITSVMSGAALSIPGIGVSAEMGNNPAQGNRVGMIGLDTSHCIAFTKALNNPKAGPEFGGYKVVAAFPTAGSSDLPASISRLADITEQVRGEGVEIVNSMEELLNRVDVVILTTVDGRKHLEQAIPVIKAGKPMFIDKPMAASLTDALKIFDTSKRYNVPLFSSSSLRYIGGITEIEEGKIGKVIGADTYGPAKIEKTHPDLFWYGIHGIEALFALMGVGCEKVSRVNTPDTDMVVGTWKDGRIGSYRGTRSGKGNFGGIVFGEKGDQVLGEYKGYSILLEEIIKFFRSGIVPVSAEETLEIIAFMEAADESKLKGGIPVNLQTIMGKGKNSSMNSEKITG